MFTSCIYCQVINGRNKHSKKKKKKKTSKKVLFTKFCVSSFNKC